MIIKRLSSAENHHNDLSDRKLCFLRSYCFAMTSDSGGIIVTQDQSYKTKNSIYNQQQGRSVHEINVPSCSYRWEEEAGGDHYQLLHKKGMGHSEDCIVLYPKETILFLKMVLIIFDLDKERIRSMNQEASCQGLVRLLGLYGFKVAFWTGSWGQYLAGYCYSCPWMTP